MAYPNQFMNQRNSSPAGIYTVPNIGPNIGIGGKTPSTARNKFGQLSNMRGSKGKSIRSGQTSKAQSPKRPIKTLEDKIEELTKMMKAEPKKKSLAGFSVNNDLLEQWKKIGALTVEDI